MMCICFVFGIQIGYPRFAGDARKGPNPAMFLEDMRELKPTLFGSFPLLYNKIFRNVMNRIANESAVTQYIF